MGFIEQADEKLQDATGFGLFGSDIGDDVSDFVTGKDAADAAEEAAALQAAAGTDAISNLRQAQIEAAARQQPFEQFGTEQGIGQLPGLFQQQQSAINDPTSVLSNPFFQAMARDQEQRLINIQGARGKGFSGGTQDALARQQLLLGNQFSQQNIGNIQGQIQNQFNAATIGQNAATQTGVQALNTAGNIGGVLGNIANAQAAGVIGQQQAGAQGFQNLLGLGSLIAAPFTGGASLGFGSGLSDPGGGPGFSDQRLKENIQFSHKHPNIGVNIYTWDWTEEAKAIVGDQDEVGPIAQELRLTRPDLVITDPETGFLQVLM